MPLPDVAWLQRYRGCNAIMNQTPATERVRAAIGRSSPNPGPAISRHVSLDRLPTKQIVLREVLRDLPRFGRSEKNRIAHFERCNSLRQSKRRLHLAEPL